jgi:hypothetical protein
MLEKETFVRNIREQKKTKLTNLNTYIKIISYVFINAIILIKNVN